MSVFLEIFFVLLIPVFFFVLIFILFLSGWVEMESVRKKIEHGDRRERRWVGCARSGGRKKHDQNMLYENKTMRTYIHT